MPGCAPLKGIRVLELAGYLSGPYAGGLLESLGAEVVKVEPVKGGYPFRRGQNEANAYFAQYNAGKKSIAVNLKHPSGIALIKALLPRFDVLLENARPGKTAALGLGPEVCRAINPHLIYASVSGFGDGGPLRDRPAYDTIGQSLGGLISLMSDPGESKLTGACMVDLVTSLTCAAGILAALVGRSRDPEQRGDLMETSLLEGVTMVTVDALTHFFETGESPTRESRHSNAHAFTMRTGGGGDIAVQASSSTVFWRSLMRVIGREELVADARFGAYQDRLANFDEIRAIVEAEFLKRPRAEWEELLLAADLPFAPVNSIEDVVKHPQTEWLQLIETERDGRPLVRPPWRFSGERPHRLGATPRVGAETQAIASEVLPQSEIERLLADGVLFES